MSQRECIVNGLRWSVITSHDRPPIPDRRYDWTCFAYDYKPGDPVGKGETEDEAMADWVKRMEEL